LKEKAPAFQWYPKQYLGDDKVLAMEWDARGMHVHLLNLSWQQEPVGSIPDDIGTLRRWLGLPSGSADADRVWARVWPQIMPAWALKDGRRFNAGMIKTWERQQTYKQNGSKPKAKGKQSLEDEDSNSNTKTKTVRKEWTGDDLAHHLLREAGIVALDDLPQIVSQAIELKQKNSGWEMEKVFLHMLERATAAKSAKYRGKWRDWFAGGDYDKSADVWRDKKEEQKDRGYIPLKKKPE
jgi:hypothetical protein